MTMLRDREAEGAAGVRERPILLSAPMVLATLEGRKNNTRRVVLPQPEQPLRSAYQNVLTREVLWGHGEGYGPARGDLEYSDGTIRPMAVAKCKTWRCPYGRVGDRLWVREAFGWKPENPAHTGLAARLIYRADHPDRTPDGVRWHPSIHLPRCWSRLTLELTDVRVERLQDMTVADAVAESVWQWGPLGPPQLAGSLYLRDCPKALELWRALWDGLNGKRGWAWETNPWVWVLAFRKLDPST